MNTLVKRETNTAVPAVDYNIPLDLLDVEMPVIGENGKIATLNKTGYMEVVNDKVTNAFVNFAKTVKQPCLDVGAAFGGVTKQLLNNGNQVIANDIDKGHLALIKKTTPNEQLDNLYLYHGRFPIEVDFTKESLSAVMLKRVLHFLSPDEIVLGLGKIYQWLEPGGKVFIVVISPNHPYFKDFKAIYNRRWANGDCWPGVISNLKKYIPDQSGYVPDDIHVMDERPLARAIESLGFTIEYADHFNNDTHVNSDLLTGIDGVFGLIAKK